MSSKQKKLFKNSTTYTQDIYIEFLDFHSKTFTFSYMLYTIFWTLLLLLCMYLSFGIGNIFQGIVLTLGLILFLGYRIYRPKMIVKKEKKSDKFTSNNTNTFIFFDKNFEVKNNNGTFTYRYFMLHKVFETKDFFYLYVTRENAFLISKSAFSLGSSDDFSKFIKKKCGIKFKKKFIN